METSDIIINIINSVLGTPKRDYAGSGGWYEYNCPQCTDENGGVEDNKYNLAVNSNELYCHCWKCGYSGKLSKLIKDYGSKELLDNYRSEISALRERLKYTLSNDAFEINDIVGDIAEIELPKGFKKISFDDPLAKFAVKYLKGRGIGIDIVEKFSIGYTTPLSTNDSSMKWRIILPSYDAFGCLNYWVGRDYSGTAFMKYKNTDVEKKSIVFNEGMINWYEPVTLVEGPFDHIVVPNSIPLLGKTIGTDYAVFKSIIKHSRSDINIFLDPDAIENALKMYKFLNSTNLCGRVKLIESYNNLDASDIYKIYGKKGILSLLRRARKLNDFDFIRI